MMMLEPDWKDCWRWLSVHAMALALALQGTWLALPDDLKALVPSWVAQAVTGALLVAGLVGRVVHQPSRRPDDTDEAGA